MAANIPPTTASGRIPLQLDEGSGAPLYLRGELRSAGRTLASAALTFPLQGRLPPSEAYPDPLLVPLGWGGESTGTWGASWSGMAGEVWLDAFPSSPGELQTQAYLEFAYLNVVDGTPIEVCSRGNLPMKADGLVPEPAHVSPSGPEEAPYTIGDWTCIRSVLELRDPAIPIRIGHFPAFEGRRPEQATMASSSSEMPDRFTWQVWIRSLGDAEFEAPPVADAGQKLMAPAAAQTTGGIVYLATKGNVARSRDFYTSPSPHWEDVKGALPIPIGGWGGIIEFALDPFDPENRAWVVLGEVGGGGGYAAVWRTDNLDATTPTWTEVLSEAQIAAALGGGSGGGKRILASNLQPGLLFVVLKWSSGLAVGRSTDYGSTWTWEPAIGIVVDRVPGFELSDQDVARLWVAVNQTGRILVSNNGGDSFGLLEDFGSFWHPYDIHSPAADNPTDQVMFTVVDNPNDADLLRSSDGGVTWSIVTYPGIYPGRLNKMVGTFAGDRQQAFYTRGGTCESWWFQHSTDGGLTWTNRFFISGALSAAWMWPEDSTRLLTARANGASGPGQTLNAMFSSDGGYSWQDKTGDWSSTIGQYFGNPGTCGGAGSVTILDTQGAAAAVSEDAVLSFCSAGKGFADDRECSFSRQAGTQGPAGDPINTRTGGFDYPVDDLSIPTSAGNLLFQRSYSSLATDVYTTAIGYGWTHNHNTELIFPGDPGGVAGRVLFKAHSANTYEFIDRGDGTYSASPGLGATLAANAGPPITYTLVDDSQNEYTFDEFGALLTWEDPTGHTWTYAYDGNGRLDTVTDDSGQRFIDLTYDPQGRIERVADHTGRDVEFGYDPAGDLTSYTDILDQAWTYVYDTSHRLRKVIDPTGDDAVHTEYDAQGRAFQQYDADNNLVLEITYNSDGTSVVEDALGNQTTHTYDQRNTLTGQTDPLANPSSREYDGNFRPTLITDENANDTQLTWSADGANLETIVDGEQNTIDLGYDALNNLTQITDGSGNATIYDYNEADPDPARRTLLLSVEDALNKVTNYTYTTAADAPQPPGLLKTITDPNGNVTQFVYDQFGQRIEVIDPLNNSTLFTYDSLGRLRTVEDPLGHVNWTCYDATGRVVRTVANASGDGGSPQTDPCDTANYQPSTDPAFDRITTSVYDNAGNLIATIDPAGVIMRTYYDSNNRPRFVVQNLVGQGIEVDTPPTYNSAFPDRNVRTETVYDAQGNAIATIDNAGIITRTYYDALNRPQYFVVNLVGQDISVGTPPAYNPSTPDQNVRTERVYDDAGNPIATIDTLGMITRTYYDANNRPETVVQNLVGQPITNTTPPARDPAFPDRNLRTDTTYDENGNPIATTDPLGIITRTYYDALNRPEYVVTNLIGQDIGVGTPPVYDPAFPDRNVRTQFVYDDAGNQIASIDTHGVIIRTYYDDGNRPTDVVQNLTGQGIEVGTPPVYNPAFPDQNVRTQTVYDDAGRTIAIIDNAGVITRTYYDGLGRARYVVRNLTGQAIDVETPPAYNPAFPDQNVRTENVYDANGDAIATIDPNGVITRTYYDDLHRPVTVVQNLTGQPISDTTPPTFNPAYPDQNVRTDSVYGDGGQVTRTTDTRGHATVSCYDGQYRVVKSVQNPTVGSPCSSYTPSGQPDEDLITLTAYDGAGSRLSITDPNGKQTTFGYDEVYRLDTETDPLGHPTTFGYDLNGNRVSMTDAELVVTRYEYDALARLTAVVENYLQGITPNQETNVRTEYAYDGLGNRLSILDGNSHSTTFTYDALGRLKTESDALSHTTTYAYDAVGNRASLLDANGFTTVLAYDDLNRLTAIDYPAPDADVVFTYDAAGNRRTMTDGLGATQWIYDDLNRPTSIAHPIGGTVAYGYNGAGDRTSLTYPGTASVSYVYDDAGRLQTVTDWDTLLTTYVFDKGGRLGNVTLPNGIVSSYTYNDARQLLSLTHIKASTTYASYGYTYDDVGNRLTATESVLTPAVVSTPDNIFANGFESGTLGAWSSSSTGSGTLTVTTSAALDGTYGMQALINSTSARYVQDRIPNAEPRYRARFYFDPNSSNMANNNAYYLFYGYTGSSTVVLRVEFGFTTAGGYRVRVNALNNSSTWTNSAWVNTTDAAHYFELDWQSATSGRVDWWIDGAAQAGVTGFDNSTRRIDQVRLGTVARLDAGTSGTVYFDAFESRRQTYIGSATALPDAIFSDDFESGGFGYWSASTGVSVTTAASLAPAGTKGMSVPLASATTAKYVTDRVPGVEPRYRARFYFDPNSITMANNADHVIFYGDSRTAPVLRLDLGYTTAGGYRLRTRIRDNASIWNNSAWLNISDAPHFVELDWQSGTSGSLGWWIDEALQPAPNPINNSARRIDRVRLGAVAAVDSTTNGTLYFDAFESRRQTYIGPFPGGLVTTNIVYDYDPLYRLTAADYNGGTSYFHYTYDAVGNRQTEVTQAGTTTYTYDIANRLTSVNGVSYVWDNNGNLLNDGASTFTYDHVNRLSSVVQGPDTFTFAYNGLGDRLRQTVNGAPTNYTVDLAAGLTQVLADGMNTYLYGLARIGEEQPGGWQYDLGDALGSVRQLANSGAVVTLARSYEPFGDILTSAGGGATAFQFTGEQRDGTGLVYLRARYYASSFGLFTTRDTWSADYASPQSMNPWLYVSNNPVSFVDPTGAWRWALTGSLYHLLIENWYDGTPGGLWNPAIQLEYPIPGTPNNRADMFSVATGDIYEIEPFFPSAVAKGAQQVVGYQQALNAASAGGLLSGNYLLLFNYDWNGTPFHIGTGAGWPGRYRFPYPAAPVFDLVADYVGGGVVAYWLEPNAGFYALAARGIAAKVSNMRLVRPQNWVPQPAYQPAYVINFEELCRTALIFAGGTVLIYTIINDLTGVGIADDVATVPAGLLFLSIGTSEAFFAPVEEIPPGGSQ